MYDLFTYTVRDPVSVIILGHRRKTTYVKSLLLIFFFVHIRYETLLFTKPLFIFPISLISLSYHIIR